MAKLRLLVHLVRDTYYPGNVVEGTVEVRTEVPIKFNSLSLKFVGKERVRVETRGTDINGKSCKVFDKERTLLFKQVVALAGEPKVGGNPEAIYEMPIGSALYPFAFKLPSELPPSMSRKNGVDFAEILYACKLTYQGISNVAPIKVRRHFNVICPMPLAQYKKDKGLLFEKAFTNVFCCCCQYGYTILKYHLKRTTVGLDQDSLQIVIEVNNEDCAKPIERAKVKLHHHLMYRSIGHVKTVVTPKVTKVVLEQPVLENEGAVMHAIIPIPLDTVPTFHSFNIWSWYELEVEVCIETVSNLIHTFPIVVVQSVDPTNSHRPIVFTANAYTNFQNHMTHELGYAVPDKACDQAALIEAAAPNIKALVATDSSFSKLGVPSDAWVDIRPYADGTKCKLHELHSWSPPSTQPVVPKPNKRLAVAFPETVNPNKRTRKLKITDGGQSAVTVTETDTAKANAPKNAAAAKAAEPPKEESKPETEGAKPAEVPNTNEPKAVEPASHEPAADSPAFEAAAS